MRYRQRITKLCILFLFIIFVVEACSTDNQKGKQLVKGEKTVSSNISFSQNNTKKFNIFMIVSDAMRQDVLGCYGGETKTPNIDWLAAHGVLFKNSYSTSPWTVPSSVGIFTGNNPTTYPFKPFGEFSVRINVPDSDLLLSEVLHSLGYQTKMMIENPNAKLHNNLQGFEHISFDKSRHFDTSFTLEQKKAISSVIGEKIQAGLTYKPVYVWINQILSLKGNDRFFYLHWFLDPHSPYVPPPDFAVKVDSQKLSKPLQVYREVLTAGGHYSAYEKAYNKKLYLAEVASVDKRIGMIIDGLRQKDLLSKTYIILTADHGEQFGEHGQTGHGGFGKGANFYETLLRVPLIISGPGIAEGRKVDAPVSLLGLMPTIKDMLGVSYPDTMQGKSFAPLVYGKNAPPPTHIYFSNVVKDKPVQRDALLEDGYKLIGRSDGNYELYDLRHDPKESDNLSAERPRIVAKMSSEIDSVRVENHRRLVANEQKPVTRAPMGSAEKKAVIKHLKELGYAK